MTLAVAINNLRILPTEGADARVSRQAGLGAVGLCKRERVDLAVRNQKQYGVRLADEPAPSCRSFAPTLYSLRVFATQQEQSLEESDTYSVHNLLHMVFHLLTLEWHPLRRSMRKRQCRMCMIRIAQPSRRPSLCLLCSQLL